MLEAETLERVTALSHPDEVRDPEYATGLELAVAVALTYGLDAISASSPDEPPVPSSLYAQARRAVRSDIRLDTMLRRYVTGSAVLLSHLLSESRQPRKGPVATDPSGLLGRQTAALDRLLAAVGLEYRQEQLETPSTSRGRLERRVLGLLEGRHADTDSIPYEFRFANHIGIVAAGDHQDSRLRSWASRHDSCLLAIRPDQDLVWAWVGSRRALSEDDSASLLADLRRSETPVAIGEPAEGLEGWRLTHRQAKTAWTMVLRGHSVAARYSEVALSASILQDPILASSLTRSYLEPLSAQPDGGAELRITLRAYFEHDRNMSAAAAALRIGRHTVRRRLETVEECLGCDVATRAMEIEGALRLHEILNPAHPSRPR